MEEALDYSPVVDTYSIDTSRTKGLTVAQRPVLTMPEHQAQNDEIIARMYGLQMLQL